MYSANHESVNQLHLEEVSKASVYQLSIDRTNKPKGSGGCVIVRLLIMGYGSSSWLCLRRAESDSLELKRCLGMFDGRESKNSFI